MNKKALTNFGRKSVILLAFVILLAGSLLSQAGVTPAQAQGSQAQSVRPGWLDGITASSQALLNQGLTANARLLPSGGKVMAPTDLFNPAQMNKSFSPITINPGDISTLTVQIYNSNTFQLTSAAWTDNLPTGITVQDGSTATNDCGGTFTAGTGATSISLSGGTVPAQVGSNPGVCTVTVTVTSTTQGNLVNTIPAGTLTSTGGGYSITTTDPASATLHVNTVQAPSLSKNFAPNTMWVGQTSLLTIQIVNNDAIVALTAAGLTDTFPSGIVLADQSVVANQPTTNGNCGSPTYTAGTGTGFFSFSGASIAKTATCKVMVMVTSSTANAYSNSIPVGGLQTHQGVTNTTAATGALNVQNVSLAKAFSPGTVEAGGQSTLTITLYNPTGSDYTQAAITDTLPNPNLTYAPGSASTYCGGTVSITNANSKLNLSGGTIPAGSITTPGQCTITATVNVSSSITGKPTYTNTIAARTLTTHEGATNVLAATATLTVYAKGTGVSGTKTFNPTAIGPGASSKLTLSISNSSLITTLTGVSITDNLPTNMVVYSTPNATIGAGCGSAAFSSTPKGGDMSFTLSGATIAPGATCTFFLNVTSNFSSFYTNYVNPINITNDQNETLPSAISATLGVSQLSTTKAFYPTVVNSGGESTLTITLTNSGATPVTITSLTDTLPGTSPNYLVVAPGSTPSTTCSGGSPSATPSSQIISMTGGVVPPKVGGVNGICTITVIVQGLGKNQALTNTLYYYNVNGTLPDTTAIQAQANSTATLTITPLSIYINKGINPTLIYGGSTSTLSLQLINPNTAAADVLTGIQFTDTMPAGMTISSPPGLSTGSCGGTLTGNSGDRSFSFSGGFLAANASCTLILNVTMNTSGTLTNDIPAGAVTTFNGASSPQKADASLSNLSGASIKKAFLTNPVLVGVTSLLRITIENVTATTLTGMGMTDTLPNHLLIASTPAPVDNCGGTLTAPAGTTNIQLNNGILAANSSCTLDIPVTNDRTQGVYTNLISANALTDGQNITNTVSASDTLTVLAPPAITKSFGASATMLVNATVTLTFNITNPNATTSLTGVTFSDNLPAGMQVGSTPTATTSGCGSANFSPSAGDTTLRFGNTTAGNIVASGTCTVTVKVTATTAGPKNNTTSSVTSNNAGTGNAANALITAMLPPSISKSFGAPSVAVNGTTTLSFTITNPNTTLPLTGVGFSDTMPGGLTLTNTTIPECGGNLAITGTNKATLTGATVAANGTCTFSITVTGKTAGMQNNTTTAVTSTEGGSGNTASASITVVAAPVMTKAFSVSPIPLNGSTTLTFTITNPNASTTLTGIQFTDNFPAGLQVASTPNASVSAGCGSPNFSPHAGDTTLFFGTTTSASVVPGTPCTVTVSVTGTVAGTLNNTTSTVHTNEGGAGAAATANITVVAPPSITKSFASQGIKVGATTTLTFTITNSNAATNFTDVYFTDTLPSVLSVTNGTSTVCTTGTLTISGSNTIALTGGTVNHGATCTITVTVTGANTGIATNSVTVYSTAWGQGNTSTAGIDVGQVGIFKSFSAASVKQNTNTTLTIKIYNELSSTINSISFSDSLPSGLTVPVGSRGTFTICGSTNGETVTASSISLTGGTLTTGSSCTIAVTVTGVTAGVQNNSITNFKYNGSTAGNTTSASLTVVAPPNISKAFGASTMPVNGTATLTFTLTNPNPGTTLTGVNFTDSLLSLPNINMQVASPVVKSFVNCGNATFNPTAGSTSLTFTVGSIVIGGTCTVSVNVTTTAAGVNNNTSGAVGSNEGGTGGTASATITAMAPPSISKAFYQSGSPVSSIPLNSMATLTFSITNPNTTLALTGVGFNDPFPSGLQVASPLTFSASNCGSPIFSPKAGDSTLSFSGAMVAGGGTCTVNVNVTGTAAGALTNTTDNVTSNEGGPGNTASAPLTVVAPPSIAKSFSLPAIAQNSTATLTFIITNPIANTVPLTGVQFTDVLPSGLTATNESGTPQCGGTVTISGSNTITLSGVTIDTVSRLCTFNVTVTGASPGTQNNTTGAVSSGNGGAGNTASASILVIAPPTIAKSFSPPSVLLNGVSVLSFNIENNNTTTTLTGVEFIDNFPTGMVVDNTPNIHIDTTGCGSGAAFSPTPKGGDISLSFSGAAIEPGGICTVTVQVDGKVLGNEVNSDYHVNSNEGDSSSGSPSTLVVNAGADLSITKTDNITLVQAGNPTTYTIVVSNAGPSAGDGAKFADPAVSNLSVTSVTCDSTTGGAVCPDPANTSVALMQSTGIVIPTLPANSTVTFSVTGTAGASGSIDNVADISTPAGLSDPNTSNNSAEDTDTITPVADLAVAKDDGQSTVTYGTDTTYTLTLTNHGPSAADSSKISDPAASGLTKSSIGACTPSIGAVCPTLGDGDGQLNIAHLEAGTVVVPTLPSGSSISFTVTDHVTATSGTVTNVFSASAPSGVTDPNTGNNSASDTDNIYAADVSISLAHVDPFIIGKNATYTIIVGDAGTTNAIGGMTVHDTLPIGETFVSATGSGWSCLASGQDVTCTNPNTSGLTPGNNLPTITLTVFLEQSLTGQLTVVDTATVDFTGDTNPLNNTSTDTASLVEVTDPAVVKTVDNPHPHPGGSVTYTVVATNNGPTNATGVKVTDQLPSGLTFVSYDATQGTYESSSGIWDIGALANGASVTMHLNATIAASIPEGTVIVNQARVTGEETDSNPNNNDSSASITATDPPQISKAFGATDIIVNGTTSLTFTINNPNSSTDFTDVTFSDPLPDGLTVSDGTFNDQCGTGSTVTTSGSSYTVILTNGSIAAGGSCSFNVTVKGATAGVKNNTTGYVSSTEGGQGNQAIASINVDPPTAVDVGSFSILWQKGSGVELHWSTVQEVNTLGFNIYRRANGQGDWTLVTPSLLASKNPGSLFGATYTFTDTSVDGKVWYEYRIDVINTAGAVSDSVTAVVFTDPYQMFLPLLKN